MSQVSRDLLLMLLCAAAPWSAAHAQSIHKCLSDGSLQYQTAPCEGTQISVPHSVPVSSSTAVVDRRPSAHPVTAGAPAPRPTEFATRPTDVGSQWSGELVLGMSDTAILNRAGWGKPQNIARGRSPEGYREEWTYVARRDGSMRTLQFVNGRLAGMNLDAGVTVAAQPPAALATTAAIAKPAPAIQRPAVAVAATAEVPAPLQQVAVVPAPADSDAERASEAAKVLESSGLAREVGRPSVAAATLVPSASSQTDAKRLPEEENGGRNAGGPSQDAIVMVGTP